MSKDKPNQHFVMAVFENDDAAQAAITNLEGWDIARQDVSLGTIGTIYKKNGKVKTDMGRKTGTGAKVGAVLGVAGALLGPVGLIGGLLAGALVGAGAGTIFTQHMKLTDEEAAQLNKDLDDGKVAVVVACDQYEMDGAAINLRESGGNVFTFSVPIDELKEAAPEAEDAATADDQKA
ncbi:MAG: hypothetical protein H6649_14140 [Caldilineae bacterium]|nr:hypothetical protein [Anaerolineae bacterium]MCB0200048.1 hypothetical protein [Anaerolineae bacterium]MCB0205357.1 hypothetical protein [Anaerolineae bacterium]MCB0252973.1 hypothetical protein [Anaerolineae bacterium]MCB9155179.1 hypothetical protein [Caldilineae bacterium]